jgi:hypothetical protein
MSTIHCRLRRGLSFVADLHRPLRAGDDRAGDDLEDTLPGKTSARAYRTFDKISQVDQGAIADNKRLGRILAMIRDEPLRRGPERPVARGAEISGTAVYSRSAEDFTIEASRKCLI